MSTQAVSNVLAGAQAVFAKLRQTQGNGNNNAQHFPAFIVNISATQKSAATDAAATDRIFQQREDFRQQRKIEIQQLGQALQSGDGDAAQQAYDALVALGQNGPLQNGQTFHRADRAQDFAAIGQALQSGDLAGAKQAFTDLANTFGHRNQLPPEPPTPAPPPTTLPPISALPPRTIPPGPPTPVPPPTTLPPITTLPHMLPPGPPTLLPPPTTLPPHTQLPLTSGGGPSAGTTNYQLVVNVFDNGSNSSVQGSSLSLKA
jgi:hypothetical protein